MARYFFHLHNDLETRDEEGIELPDLATARAVAAREARAIAADNVSNGHLVLSHSIEVCDERGSVVCRLRFGDVIEIAQ